MFLPVIGLAATLALGQPLSALQAAPLTAPISADAPAPTDLDSTAVKLRELDTRMTVAVTINGAGPFRFIVDSGATRTVISRALAETLHLPSAGKVALHSVGGESEVDSVRIGALTLGGLPAQPLVAPVLDEANLGAAGILGIDALAGKKVVIDLAANSMSVEPADKMRPRTGDDEIVVVARRRYGQLVLADADASGQRIFAIVDTGSMVTIGNTPLQTRLVQHHRAAPQQTIITDVVGRQIAALYAPISDMRLSQWHMSNVVVAFSDVHAFDRFGLADKPSMLLGMDMLRAFRRVAIDFSRRTVRLTRYHTDAEAGPVLSLLPG